MVRIWSILTNPDPPPSVNYPRNRLHMSIQKIPRNPEILLRIPCENLETRKTENTAAYFQKNVFFIISIENEPFLILGSQNSCNFPLRASKSATSLTWEGRISELRRSWVMFVGSMIACVSSASRWNDPAAR